MTYLRHKLIGLILFGIAITLAAFYKLQPKNFIKLYYINLPPMTNNEAMQQPDGDDEEKCADCKNNIGSYKLTNAIGNKSTEEIIEEWLSTIVLKAQVECPNVEKKDQSEKKSSSCRVPELDPFHPSIMQFIKKARPPNCPGKTFGVLQDGLLNFADSNVVSASYRPVIRVGDFTYRLGPPVAAGSNKITEEMIEVDYKLKSGKTVKDFLIQVLPRQNLLEREGARKPGMALNIFVLGVDSLSYANCVRKLPKVYDFLKNEVGALFFQGHAIVGDGTTPQLTAMLTGKHVEEQYEARTGKPGAKPLDGWTWVFKELKEHGYLTGFTEDGIWDGPFQYRLKGFTSPPTDFYPRPFFIDIAKRTKVFTDRCINNRNVPQIHFEYIRSVFDAYPKKLKFFVSFNAGYSHHEINDVQKNEEYMMSILKDFKAKGYLDNTMLIVMGDHGLRFGKVRTQVQGKLEERLPLFAVALPPWFKSRYPSILKVLETNTGRLTSWFDVYATFRHVLSYPDLPAGLTRGVSLFTEVPESRSCKDAGVSNHWCPCLQWVTVNVDHVHIQTAGKAVVEYMNAVIGRDNASAALCAKLSLKAINFAQLERPNEAVVKQYLKAGAAFKQSKEYFCRYQLQLVTSPNEGVFEATVKYHKNRFTVTSSISRINMYGDQPKCVAARLPHIRKYCLCKDYKGTL